MTSAPPVVLAAAADDGLMAALAAGIEAGGLPVARVELDARAEDDDEHEARFRQALAAVSAPPIIGGFSLGARIAARICPDVAPLALLCFAYPFHAPGDPARRTGLEALSRVRAPVRIIQGTRDPHGTEADVRGYRLPETVELVWLADGNHRFVPRSRSGLTHAAHVEAAVASALELIRRR